MATLAQLRKQAKDLGVPRDFILKASSTTLQAMVDDAQAHDGKPKRAVKKSTVRKASATRKAATEQPKRRGRPPGSKNKPKTGTAVISKSASIKSKPAAKKSTVGKAKRSTAVATKKATTKKDALVTRNYNKKEVEPQDGRYTLSEIDYSENEGWNPRPGSTPDVIQRLLKRFRGNRNKVFLAIYEAGDLYEHVGRKKQDGSKRTEAQAIDMLKYRIARTDWDFALKTGQHEKSENRIEYGTGENATVRAKKPTPKKRTAARKAVVKPKARKATSATARKKKATQTTRRTAQKGTGRRVTARKAASARK